MGLSTLPCTNARTFPRVNSAWLHHLEINSLREGQYFGELPFILDSVTAHTASVVTTTACTVLVLERIDFWQHMGRVRELLLDYAHTFYEDESSISETLHRQGAC